MRSFFTSSSNPLSKILDRTIYKYLSQESIGWKVDARLALLAFSISIFLAFPSLWLYLRPDRAGRLLHQMLLAENPLNRDLPYTAQILSYRFFVPMLNYFIGFRGFGVVVIPVLASFFNLFLCSRILRKRTNDIRLTAFSLIGLSLTWFIAEGTSFLGTTDSVSHLLLLIPAAFKLSPVNLFLCITSSLFVDERSIFAIAFLFLFLIRRDYPTDSSINYSIQRFPGFSLPKTSLYNAFAISLGLAFWLVIRYVISSGLLAPSPDITVVTSQIPNFPAFISVYWPPQILNYLSSFKWYYFFPFFLIINLAKMSSNKSISENGLNLRGYYNIYLFIFISYSLIVMINGDVWRSMAFSYFFILESILILYTFRERFTIALSRCLMLLMVITPVSFFGIHLTPQISFPLPIVLLRTYAGLGESIVPWIRDLFPAYLPS